MPKKLLPFAVVLFILALGAIASSNLNQLNRAEAQPPLTQTVSAPETEQFRKLLVDYYAAWSIPTDKAWKITKAEKYISRAIACLASISIHRRKGFKAGRLTNAN